MRADASASEVACDERARWGQFYGLCLARALRPVLWPVMSAPAAASAVASAESARASAIAFAERARCRQFRGMSARNEDKPVGGGERARFKNYCIVKRARYNQLCAEQARLAHTKN